MPPTRSSGSHRTLCSCRSCSPLFSLFPFEPLRPLQTRFPLLQRMTGCYYTLSTLASGQCIWPKHETRWPWGPRWTLPANRPFLSLQPWPTICTWHPWYPVTSRASRWSRSALCSNVTHLTPCTFYPFWSREPTFSFVTLVTTWSSWARRPLYMSQVKQSQVTLFCWLLILYVCFDLSTLFSFSLQTQLTNSSSKLWGKGSLVLLIIIWKLRRFLILYFFTIWT